MDPERKKLHIKKLEFDLRTMLCKCLNIENVFGNDWRGLASILGYDYIQITAFYTVPNPTNSLLENWGHRTASTLGVLESALIKLNREDLCPLLVPGNKKSECHLPKPSENEFNEYQYFTSLLHEKEDVRRSTKKPQKLQQVDRSVNEDINKHVEKGAEKDDNGLCIICFTNDKNALPLPCAHLFACSTCLEKVSMCSVCRTDISTRIKIFNV